MGGSIGVAIFGAIFNSGLRSRLSGVSVAVGEGSSFRPETLDELAPPERAAAVSAFADSLTTVFLVATPLMVIALLVLALPVTPLRTASHAHDRGRELGVTGASGSAEPDSFEYDAVPAAHHV